MWCRRQLHENTIHRVDLSTALGADRAVAPVVASDGVDELLDAFMARRRAGLAGEESRSFHISAVDTGDTWTINSSSEGVTTDSDVPGDSVLDSIAGDANAIYLVLWNRANADEVREAGSGRRLRAWSATLTVRYG